ncbi:MAG: hypothetical protein JOZ36_01000 [Acidobacteria bacterium]|nr:hypothetical protein [Acidobacteriota bacterium]
METKFPSAEAYGNEPIRYAPLEVVDVAAEQRVRQHLTNEREDHDHDHTCVSMPRPEEILT